MHNKIISRIITGKNLQFLAQPLLYKISIKKVFLINIIIYFIVPNLVSKEDPSLVQKTRPKKTFIILVVINDDVNNLQICNLNNVLNGIFDNKYDILLIKRFIIQRAIVDSDINFIKRGTIFHNFFIPIFALNGDEFIDIL